MGKSNSKEQPRVFSKNSMQSFYLDDPKLRLIERELNETKMQYFYFDDDLEIKTKKAEVLNGCLLQGEAKLFYNDEEFIINQFDFFYLPSEKTIKIEVNNRSSDTYKICLVYSKVKNQLKVDFDLQHYKKDKFIPRGEFSSKNAMATHRTVWTAMKNGYFMSGFTNIPKEVLAQGVVTSVNLVENKNGEIEIYPHIHPGHPELYLFCIPDKNTAITQYLINSDGDSICRDLTNGEGLFFPGRLGHMNFAKPTYKNLEYCMYMWIIPTFGELETVEPITLKAD
ncbi:MAG: hypothetical protein GF317_12625 [Candidatus Lokiarchaeota archaeon]|nr:hypothetical protein [Candidatus Lokiarchaeota archaeon]MBD3200492.1 hypothetical protein [Candidatus Lokiarchaeota archaeon]